MHRCSASPCTVCFPLVRRENKRRLKSPTGSLSPLLPSQAEELRRVPTRRPKRFVYAPRLRVCVCACVWQLASRARNNSSGGLLPERRMTHLPGGSESLHHHHPPLLGSRRADEIFTPVKRRSRKQGGFTNWIVERYKSPGMCNAPLRWRDAAYATPTLGPLLGVVKRAAFFSP